MKCRNKILAIFLVTGLLLSLTGCANSEETIGAGLWRSSRKETDSRKKLSFAVSKELTGGTSNTAPETRKVDGFFQNAYDNFAFRLLQENYAEKQTTGMISPYSLFMAIGMLANGTEGETRQEIEGLLGMTIEEANKYAAFFSKSLTSAKGVSFKDANSIWLRDTFSKNVEESFLKACGDYYKASVMATDFNDAKTVKDINSWIDTNTDGMIQKMFDEIDPKTASILLNAIAFDGEWHEPFEESGIREDTFFHEDGVTETKRMMNGTGDGVYYANEYCAGFRKSYSDYEYSYIALLPKDGVSIQTLLENLSGENYQNLIKNAHRGTVYIGIPEYKEEYTVSMKNMLNRMGVIKAFKEDADFGAFSKVHSLHVSDVMQKTFIEVNAEGTKAAAVTSVIVNFDSCTEAETEFRVYLNRPFVYMIVDSETNCPIFMGIYQ